MFKLNKILAAVLVSSISFSAAASNYPSFLGGEKAKQSTTYSPNEKKAAPAKIRVQIPIDLSRTVVNVSDETIEKVIPKLSKINNLNKSFKRIDTFGLDESMLMIEDSDGNIVYFDSNVEDFIISNLRFKNLGEHLVASDSIKLVTGNKKLIDEKLANMLHLFAKFEGDKNGDFQETIYVLADYTCPYCRKMFENIDLINRLGITVYYLPMLNGGLADRGGVDITRKILCSENRESDTLKAINNPREFFNNINREELNCPASYNVLSVLKMQDIFNAEATPTTIISNGFQFSGHYNMESYLKDLAHGVLDGNAILEYNKAREDNSND